MGAGQAELPGPLVHHPHEPAHAAARVLRERDRGVVPGHEQQAVEQRLELHLLPLGQQADGGSRGVPGPGGDANALVRVASLDHHERGHHLREACDREPPGRLEPPQHAAGAHVEQEPGARPVGEPQPHQVRAGQLDGEARGLAAARGRPARPSDE